MSLSGYRAQIAAALSTVAGVKGYAYRPDTLRAGDAWPLLGPLNRGPARSFEVTWRVLVYLPQDEEAASQWIDAHHEPLVDAMEDNVGFVDRCEPVAITASGNDQFAWQITMRSE